MKAETDADMKKYAEDLFEKDQKDLDEIYKEICRARATLTNYVSIKGPSSRVEKIIRDAGYAVSERDRDEWIHISWES